MFIKLKALNQALTQAKGEPGKNQRNYLRDSSDDEVNRLRDLYPDNPYISDEYKKRKKPKEVK